MVYYNTVFVPRILRSVVCASNCVDRATFSRVG